MKTNIKTLNPTWKTVLAIWITILIFFALGGERPANADSLTFGKELRKTQQEYSDLYKLQKSVAICEGWHNPESLARKNNNPGNLKSGDKRDAQGHGIFESEVRGYLEHLSLLERRYWGYTPKYMNHVLGYATNPEWYVCVDWYYYGF